MQNQNNMNDYTVRQLNISEYDVLDEFLYNAIFIPDGVAPPDMSIIKSAELQVYVKDFGKFKSDFALCAECNGKIVGAIWARIMKDYGHIDDDTPSLAISVLKEYRHKGIGTELMTQMLSLLKQQRYKYASLSVQKENYAVKLYKKLNFKTVKENGEEYIMKVDL